ncbi:ABC transporter permease [Labrys sp. WJW]|uniref:ABC transporter permease n=1 Tax=Labrys sp. WJW TaxID=1737983 RepID=UPI0008318ECE|nr:ABC transporter permease subunit [Labrys sp. WJW]OCC04392.1 ABC transporter permease [Labrys sp. WJW]
MSVISAYFPQLLQGLLVTLEVAVGSFLVGFVVAVAAVFAWSSGSRALRWLVAAYVTVIRGLPELLVIFLVFYGGTVLLTGLTGGYVEVSALVAGIAALSFVSGAYLTEILRGALQTIPAGQWEAARSLGLKQGLLFRKIILPQMFSHALPGLGNQWLVILKESALVSIVGLEELMRKGVVAAGATHQPMTFYLIVAALFILITTVSTALLSLGSSRLTWMR